METPSSQPRKRGRPKGSTKSRDDKEKDSAAGGGATPTSARMRGGAEKKNAASDEKYTNWKAVIPVLYDWFANHNLVWPSLSCRAMNCLTSKVRVW